MLEKHRARKKLSREEFARLEPKLRVQALRAQYELRDSNRAVVVVVAGSDQCGIYDVVHLAYDWLDARHVDVHMPGRESDEVRERPYFQRFWKDLPAHGRIGVFPFGWPMDLLEARLARSIKRREFEQRLEAIRAFEKQLTDNGVIVVKLWLHLDDDELKERRRNGHDDGLRPWFLADGMRKLYEKLERDDSIEEAVLDGTESKSAPWHVIRSADPQVRDVGAIRALIDAIDDGLERARKAPRKTVSARVSVPDRIAALDMSQQLDSAAYDKEIDALQARLNRLFERAYDKRISSVFVFEGSDAAGKGGAIRRVLRAVRAPIFEVVPISAPTEEERARPYLWRFWRKLPRTGHVTIFDRSWYGRVLVERVEGFASEPEWRRAYSEIVDFERQLLEHGTVLVKFWLEVDEAIQLERFEARGKVPFKKYKLTPDDFRNRAKRPLYHTAANEMFARTDHESARWNLIAANDKPFARVAVLKSIVRSLESALD